MLKNLRLKFIMIFTFIVSISSYSQSFDDLSNVNFSELNDSQIDLLLRRSGAKGFNLFDLLKMAKTQGFTQTDINNLDKRFKSALTIARIAESATAPLEDTRLRKQWLDDVEVFREIDSDVFGFNVFVWCVLYLYIFNLLHMLCVYRIECHLIDEIFTDDANR
jgi:hypothetical protein